MVKLCQVRWDGVGYPTTRSVLAFDDAATANQMASAIGPMLDLLEGVIVDSTDFVLEDEVRHVDTATGQLIGVDIEFAGVPHSGLLVENPVANAAQGLLRWATAGVVNGHRVRGRTFLPGLGESCVDVDGGLTAGALTQLVNAASGYAASPYPRIWARPLKNVGGDVLRPGTAWPITGGSAWDEFAVLRRRR